MPDFLNALLPRFIRQLWDTTNWIEAEALQAQLAGGAAPLLLDVRGADEFTGPLGHLPGALNIPLHELPARLAELDTARPGPLVAVCLSDKRSAKAAELLEKQGFAGLKVLRGGMQRWNELGYPKA